MIKETLLALLVTFSSLLNQSILYIWPAEQEIAMVDQIHQVMCGVCDEVIQDNAQNIIAINCDGQLHVTHSACMNTYLQQQNSLNCPTCKSNFSAESLEHVLIVLNDGDVVIPEDIPEVIEYIECSICLDDCEQEWPHVVTLHCQAGEHQFHLDCLYPAMHQYNQNGCPNCMIQINQDDRQMIDLAHQFVHQQDQPAQAEAPQVPHIPECIICLDDIEQNAYALPCAHVFHEQCVQAWLAQQNVCPLCNLAVN